MQTATTTDELPDARVANSPGSTIGPISHAVDTTAQRPVPLRTATDLIARHPELVANLAASLNPTPPPLAYDVALFQSAVADIQQAAADGILTTAEAGILIGAVVEGFTARRATESISSAIRSAFSPAGK